MGSVSLTTMVAGDSSFMIKTLYTFKINGVSLNIDTTHVALLLVSVFILVMAVIARIKINKVDASDTPGMFQNVIESSRILQRDAAFAQTLSDLLPQLPPIKVGRYGQIQEWTEDYEEVDIGHRHISHLFGLYPANLIDPHLTPQLSKARSLTH